MPTFQEYMQMARLRGAGAPNAMPPGAGEVAQQFLNDPAQLRTPYDPQYGATMRPTAPSVMDAMPGQVPRGYMGEGPPVEMVGDRIRAMPIHPNVGVLETPAQRAGRYTRELGSNDAALGRLLGTDPAYSMEDRINARFMSGSRGAQDPFAWERGVLPPDRVAQGMSNAGRRLGSAEKAGIIGSLMGALPNGAQDAMEGARALSQSDALGAAGAYEAAPLARGALGTAGRLVGPAMGAAALYELGKEAFDPQSPLRQASRPAKQDMARDWQEGNYARWAGDAGRAMLATGGHVVGEFLAPTPIFGENGLVQGLIGGERSDERAARLTKEAQAREESNRIEQAKKAYMEREAAQQPQQQQPADDSNYIPVQALHALGYTMPSPRVPTVMDELRAKTANMVIAASNDAWDAAKTPEEKAAVKAQLIKDLISVASPQSTIAVGGLQ